MMEDCRNAAAHKLCCWGATRVGPVLMRALLSIPSVWHRNASFIVWHGKVSLCPLAKTSQNLCLAVWVGNSGQLSEIMFSVTCSHWHLWLTSVQNCLIWLSNLEWLFFFTPDPLFHLWKARSLGWHFHGDMSSSKRKGRLSAPTKHWGNW